MGILRTCFKAMSVLFQILFLSEISFAASENPATAQTIKDVASTHAQTASDLMHIVTEYSVKYGFQALGGIIVLILGWIVAKYIANFFNKMLEEKKVDIVVAKFIAGMAKLVIMAFAVIVALGKFGIEIAPLIAGISVVGFGTSFALQGPLSNYASGVTLIFTKPFKVGDIIEVAGVVGEVIDMKLPRTEIKTLDGTLIFVPNKHIIGEVIQNFHEYKKLDIKVGVSYKSDMDKAIAAVNKVVSSEPRISQKPKAKVGISEFADSSVNIYARVWCKQDDYWDVMFDVNRSIFAQFKKDGIEIPFPQRDVHLYKES